MKTNLKTFPKLEADPTTNEQQIILWKKEFESELRLKLNSYSAVKKWAECRFENQLIEEILGETE